ncbi:hypothetical protein [Methylobacterium sp. UNC378MF]|uniref:hypothetical protein n=1 Tax=Methylobacterium sp. UNC378MF TaxID=1502748 RepID=UPI001587057A|nr:hypothetical protein [Methylobacterium sp. UNC378MF]
MTYTADDLEILLRNGALVDPASIRSHRTPLWRPVQNRRETQITLPLQASAEPGR